MGTSISEELYSRIAEDNEERVCKDIPESACREVPGNFFRILIGKTLTAAGDRIVSAKTTLPWIMNAGGAPAWMVGTLVPIREAGSMLPQVWLGGIIRGRPIRKTFWAAASLGQAVAVALIALAALFLDGVALGGAIILCLIGFALSRAFASIASKDVLGKTVPKTRRGLLAGWTTLASGLGAIAVGFGLALFFGKDSPVWILVLLPTAGVVLWLLAMFVFFSIREVPGASEGGVRVGADLISRLRLLRSEPDFGRFVIVRALAMGSALAAPFYVVLARQELGDAVLVLAVFIAIEGVGAVLSGPFLGKLADISSKRLLRAASWIAGVASLGLALWVSLVPSGWWHWLAFPGLFLVLGVAHSGVRLGRKTYLVDMAEGDKRTDFVAVSNSIMGVALFAVGGLLATVAIFSNAMAVALAGVMGVSAGLIAGAMRDVSG